MLAGWQIVGCGGVVATFEMKVEALGIAVPSADGRLLRSRQQATAEADVGRMLAVGRGKLLEGYSSAYRRIQEGGCSEGGGSGREKKPNH